MNPTDLIAGPYVVPKSRKGGVLTDLIRGDLDVVDTSDAPIPWPRGRSTPNAKRTPIVTEELARAIRTESVEAIVHHWGVSRWTARRWRHALGVGRFTEGTRALWTQAAGKLHTPKARRRQKAAMKAWSRARRAGPVE